MSIDLGELRGYIADMYSDVARFPRAEFHFPTGRPLMERLGYPAADLDRVPKGALESFAGVGYHLELDPLRSGERVLDVGSGAGSDLLTAALRVGDAGEAVGLDMTPSMVEKASKNIETAGFENARVLHGYAEELPFEDGTFDCVISNGVINLSPNKKAVFEGIHRVLGPRGRLMISDIVTGVELPESVRENCELWAECIGGAVEQRRYVRMIEQAGFRVERVEPNDLYAFTQESTIDAARKFDVRSIRILAYRSA